MPAEGCHQTIDIAGFYMWRAGLPIWQKWMGIASCKDIQINP
jgi:hypothetical protein